MSAFGGKADMTGCGCLLSRSLLGVKRTSLFAAHMSAYDPKRTSASIYIAVAKPVSARSKYSLEPILCPRSEPWQWHESAGGTQKDCFSPYGLDRSTHIARASR